MLRLIKKHLAACKKKSEKDWKCTPKSAGSRVACPFYVVGPDPRDRTAPRIKQYTNTGDERLAKAFLSNSSWPYTRNQNQSRYPRRPQKRSRKRLSISLAQRSTRARHANKNCGGNSL